MKNTQPSIHQDKTQIFNILSERKQNNLKILSQEALQSIVGGNYEGPPDPPPDPDPIGRAHRN